MIKRVLTILFAAILLLSGCTKNKVTEDHRPGKYFSNYDTLTALYGTGKMDTLKALGIDANDVDFLNENYDYFIIHRTERYAGLELDIILEFNESSLFGVENRKIYRYPDELEQAANDAVQVGKQLATDLGKPHQVDVWNDWYEEEHNIEMDEKTPAYKSSDQIKAFLEGEMGGTIMVWDMTSVACDAVKTQVKQYKVKWDSYAHRVTFGIYRIDNEIVMSICY